MKKFQKWSCHAKMFLNVQSRLSLIIFAAESSEMHQRELFRY